MKNAIGFLTLCAVVWALRVAILDGDFIGALIIMGATGLALELFTDNLFS